MLTRPIAYRRHTRAAISVLFGGRGIRLPRFRGAPAGPDYAPRATALAFATHSHFPLCLYIPIKVYFKLAVPIL